MKRIGTVYLEEVIFNITPPDIDTQILCKIEWDNNIRCRPIKGVYIKINSGEQKDVEWKELAAEHYKLIEEVLRGPEHLTYFDFPVNELRSFYRKKTIDELFRVVQDLI